VKTFCLIAALVVAAVATLIGFDVITVHEHAAGWFPLAFTLFVLSALVPD